MRTCLSSHRIHSCYIYTVYRLSVIPFLPAFSSSSYSPLLSFYLLGLVLTVFPLPLSSLPSCISCFALPELPLFLSRITLCVIWQSPVSPSRDFAWCLRAFNASHLFVAGGGTCQHSASFGLVLQRFRVSMRRRAIANRMSVYVPSLTLSVAVSWDLRRRLLVLFSLRYAALHDLACGILSTALGRYRELSYSSRSFIASSRYVVIRIVDRARGAAYVFVYLFFLLVLESLVFLLLHF